MVRTEQRLDKFIYWWHGQNSGSISLYWDQDKTKKIHILRWSDLILFNFLLILFDSISAEEKKKRSFRLLFATSRDCRVVHHARYGETEKERAKEMLSVPLETSKGLHKVDMLGGGGGG